MRTFVVDEKANQTRSKVPTYQGHDMLRSIANLTSGGLPEAYGANLTNLVTVESNAFIETLTRSYARHYPLTLSPDDVWMTIAQSVALHVDQNDELLRHHFVEHEGKVKIVWRNDALVKGSPDNQWMDGFNFFAEEIKKYIGKKHDLLTANFSTTGPIELAASQVVLMDAMKHYFSYGVQTLCGIPEITLLGTVDDWKSIRNRVQALAEFIGLETWVRTLDPILSEFVNAQEGRINQAFWKEIYKSDSRGSGNPYVTGWANAFFLYMQDLNGFIRNPLADNLKADYNPATHTYPSGVCRVPFEWEYRGDTFPYEFLGGFLAVHQDPETLGVRPAMGWAVREV